MTQRRNKQQITEAIVSMRDYGDPGRTTRSTKRGTYGEEVAYEVEHRGTKQWKRCVKQVKALVERYPTITLEQLQEHLDFDKMLVKRVFVNGI